MAYFPLYVDMEKKNCVVVGGGSVAAGKVSQLLEFGASVTVVAPKAADSFFQWEKSGLIRLIQRIFCEEDLAAADIVVAATDKKEVNRRVSEFCQKARIPVNVVDDKELCTFYFPALIKRGGVVVSVSTGGKSPALSARIKRDLDQQIPESYAAAAETLGRFRDMVIEQTKDREQRKQIFWQMVEDVLAQKEITSKEVAEYIENTGKNKNRHAGKYSCTDAD